MATFDVLSKSILISKQKKDWYDEILANIGNGGGAIQEPPPPPAVIPTHNELINLDLRIGFPNYINSTLEIRAEIINSNGAVIAEGAISNFINNPGIPPNYINLKLKPTTLSGNVSPDKLYVLSIKFKGSYSTGKATKNYFIADTIPLMTN